MYKLSRQYLESQYKMAVMDFKTALDEDAQWDARMEMAKLEKLALEMYDDEFAIKLNDIAKSQIKL